MEKYRIEFPEIPKKERRWLPFSRQKKSPEPRKKYSPEEVLEAATRRPKLVYAGWFIGIILIWFGFEMATLEEIVGIVPGFMALDPLIGGFSLMLIGMFFLAFYMGIGAEKMRIWRAWRLAESMEETTPKIEQPSPNDNQHSKIPFLSPDPPVEDIKRVTELKEIPFEMLETTPLEQDSTPEKVERVSKK